MQNVLNFSLNEINIGCGCSACANNDSTNTTYKYSMNNNDEQVIDSSAPSGMAGKEEFGSYLTDGYWQDAYSQYGTQWANANYEGWSKTNLTFSIGNWYSNSEKAGIRDAFDQWSDVTNLNFSEVGSGGDIYFDAPQGGDSGRAYASVGFGLSGGVATINGPIRVMIDYDSGNFGSDATDLGNYALTTAIHEIGHAIGLGHSGWYNAGQGNPNYNNDGQWINDTRQYSLMSYWSASNSGANHQGEYSSTPMLMDIYAVQTLYGADNSTRSGNTTYGFNSNAGRDQFDFTVNVEPVVAIWDGGGTDTLDVSGWSMAQIINLEAGSFSNVGGGTGNLAIAYGATIENARGGGGADTIYGNDSDNVLLGGAGNDTFYGSAGDDTINGQGGGADEVIYSYDISAFLIDLVNGSSFTFSHIADGWTDTLTNVENYVLDSISYSYNQILELASEIQTITFDMDWSGGNYSVDLEEEAVTTLSGSDLGYNGNNNDQVSLDRSEYGLVVEILDSNMPDDLTITAGISDDTIKILGQNHVLSTVAINAGDGEDFIVMGVRSDDIINGEDGNDNISAASGNDIINGGAGDDYIHAGNGDDMINGGEGEDEIIGGLGTDTITFEGATQKVEVRLANNWVRNDGFGNGETIANIENLFGSAQIDELYGDDNANELRGFGGDDVLLGFGSNDLLIGGDGSDVLDGGDGVDTVTFADATEGVSLTMSTNTVSNDGFGNSEVIRDIENIIGSDYNDTIYASNQDNDIRTGNGNDYIFTGQGKDFVDAGDGIDTASFAGANQSVVVNLANEWARDDGHGNGEHLRGIENLHGSSQTDQFFGDAQDNELYGYGGDDFLFGGGGNDYINGGGGKDVIDGEGGNDTASFDGATQTVKVNLDNQWVADDGFGNGEKIRNIQNLDGSDQTDQFFGDSQDNVFRGYDGDDFLFGGAGSDTLIGGAGTDVLRGQGGSDIFGFTSFDGSVDQIKDFTVTGGSSDQINITDLLSGFSQGSSDLNNFARLINQNSATADLQVNADGQGTDFVTIAHLRGSDFNGLSIDDLSSNIITNETLIA